MEGMEVERSLASWMPWCWKIILIFRSMLPPAPLRFIHVTYCGPNDLQAKKIQAEIHKGANVTNSKAWCAGETNLHAIIAVSKPMLCQGGEKGFYPRKEWMRYQAPKMESVKSVSAPGRNGTEYFSTMDPSDSQVVMLLDKSMFTMRRKDPFQPSDQKGKWMNTNGICSCDCKTERFPWKLICDIQTLWTMRQTY